MLKLHRGARQVGVNAQHGGGNATTDLFEIGEFGLRVFQ